jgi:4-hydroxy-tetrahydrodipicolinate synthase
MKDKGGFVAEKNLYGVVVPTITPTDADERVDEPGFRRLIKRLISAGVHGLFVGGSAGEGPLLAAGEWQRMTEIAFDEAKGAIPLLAGVMDTSTKRICEKVRHLRKIGYSRFVLTPSFYIAAKTPSEQLREFGAAREAGGTMEMIPYNIPRCTGAAFAVDTLCEMARRGWVRACKESSGDIAYFTELVNRGREAGLVVLGGDEVILVEELRAGAAGFVPGVANIFAPFCLRVWEAAARKDWAAVTAAHKEMMRVRAPLVTGAASWVSGLKYAASLLSMGSGVALSPLEPVVAAQKAEIEALVAKDAVR